MGGVEGRVAGEQAIQDGAGGIDVGGGADLVRLAGGLFGGHVGGGPQHLAGHGQIADPFDLLGEAEVGDLGAAVLVQQDVAGLEVAVNDAALVGVGHRFGHRHDQLGGFPGRQRPSLDPVGEAAAFDVAHREVVLAVIFADLKDRYDAGVIELGSRLGFALEALDVLIRGQLPRQDHLERDNPVQAASGGLCKRCPCRRGQCVAADQFVIT